MLQTEIMRRLYFEFFSKEMLTVMLLKPSRLIIETPYLEMALLGIVTLGVLLFLVHSITKFSGNKSLFKKRQGN